MATHTYGPDAYQAANELTTKRDVNLNQPIGTPAVSESGRTKQGVKPLSARVRIIQARVAAFNATGAAADKAFFDELSGDL